MTDQGGAYSGNYELIEKSLILESPNSEPYINFEGNTLGTVKPDNHSKAEDKVNKYMLAREG